MCTSAYVNAQTRRSEHKLLAARDELRTCARRECSSLMRGQLVKDCADWLTQVEAAIPSVVLSAKDDSGTDLTAMTVAIDGAVVATLLDGRSIDVDPGPHVFTFETAGAAKVSVTLLALEGTKDQLVKATLASASRAPESTPPPPPPPLAPPEAPTGPNKTLLVGGIVSLSVGYFVAVLGGAIVLASRGSSNGSSSTNCLGSAGFAFIPLVGPFLTLANYTDYQIVTYGTSQGSAAIGVGDCNGSRSTVTGAVIADEVLQLGGLAALGTGLLLRSPVQPSGTGRIGAIEVVPGAPAAPLGATLRVIGF
jgi:hypothetical protein